MVASDTYRCHPQSYEIYLFLCVTSASRFKLIHASVFQTSLYFVDTTKCNWNITTINFLFVSGNFLLVSNAARIFDPDPYIHSRLEIKGSESLTVALANLPPFLLSSQTVALVQAY